MILKTTVKKCTNGCALDHFHVLHDALGAHAYRLAKRDMQAAAKNLGDEHVLGALDAFEIRATEYHAKMLAGKSV